MLEARNRWRERGPASYQMTLQRSCECLPSDAGPFVVTVRNGVVESRTYPQSNTSIPEHLADVFPSVEGLFVMIEHAINERWPVVTVTYDRALG
ncbi:MAG: DUF6174 domain-containing protein, partial [Gemmatimonadaceae bacterium]